MVLLVLPLISVSTNLDANESQNMLWYHPIVQEYTISSHIIKLLATSVGNLRKWVENIVSELSHTIRIIVGGPMLHCNFILQSYNSALPLQKPHLTQHCQIWGDLGSDSKQLEWVEDILQMAINNNIDRDLTNVTLPDHTVVYNLRITKNRKNRFCGISQHV